MTMVFLVVVVVVEEEAIAACAQCRGIKQKCVPPTKK